MTPDSDRTNTRTFAHQARTVIVACGKGDRLVAVFMKRFPGESASGHPDVKGTGRASPCMFYEP